MPGLFFRSAMARPATAARRAATQHSVPTAAAKSAQAPAAPSKASGETKLLSNLFAGTRWRRFSTTTGVPPHQAARCTLSPWQRGTTVPWERRFRTPERAAAARMLEAKRAWRRRSDEQLPGWAQGVEAKLFGTKYDEGKKLSTLGEWEYTARGGDGEEQPHALAGHDYRDEWRKAVDQGVAGSENTVAPQTQTVAATYAGPRPTVTSGLAPAKGALHKFQPVVPAHRRSFATGERFRGGVEERSAAPAGDAHSLRTGGAFRAGALGFFAIVLAGTAIDQAQAEEGL